MKAQLRYSTQQMRYQQCLQRVTNGPCVPGVARYDVASGISCIDGHSFTKCPGDRGGATSVWRPLIMGLQLDRHTEDACEIYK